MSKQHFTQKTFVATLFSLILASNPAPAQEGAFATLSHSFSMIITRVGVDSLVQLPHRFLITASEVVIAEWGDTLRNGQEYTIDYINGELSWIRGSLLPALDDGNSVGMTISYRYLPLTFRESYYRRRLIELDDTASTDTIRIVQPRAPLGLDDIFGRDLQKSGSIFRGFTVGSNRDLSLNSGFRMQLAGKIASDVEVVAALTDENTPIQPEGTTQTLQEFDKVYVEIRSTDYSATLGDFPLEFQGSEFARLSRKLQGAQGKGVFHLGSATGTALVAGAVTRGKYATNQFNGIEGVQGPYRLFGRNNERNIIVIAGTERVYVNGEQQVRGETNDYSVDYSTAEIRFTPRRLITSASRITVDFEYSDRQFSRSLFAAHTSTAFASEKARLSFSYFREADDPDSPIDLELTESTRQVLANAGDDRNKAIVSGVTKVDSNGLYIRVDTTLVTGEEVTFYRYAPGDPLALYTVGFTYVGSGRGEYQRRAVGQFEWRGPGGGDYLPVRFLPFAQLQNLVDVGLDLTPFESMKLSGEFARSMFDANRFSGLDDGDNGGNAFSVGATFSPRQVHAGDVLLGDFDLQFKERFVQGRFIPIDRMNEIEFSRKWGVDSLLAADERTREASLRYSPAREFSIAGGYGRITRGDDMHSVRNDITATLRGAGMPTAEYFLETIRSRESLFDNSSRWLRQRGSAEYVVTVVKPTFRFEAETRNVRSAVSGTEKPGSAAHAVYAPGIWFPQLGKLSLASEFEWRTDDRFLDGQVVRESKSFTHSYNARLANWNNLTSSFELALRNKKYGAAFRQTGSRDIRTVLVRSQSRYTPFNRGLDSDLLYQVATERSAKLERVFVRVPQGTGNYKYLGDVNNNGVADEEEFEPTRFDGDYIVVTLPSDELFPVIDLRTSLRLRVVPARFIEPTEGIARVFSRMLSSETYIRVEEKSTEEDLKQIYLLRFSRFQKEATTIAGSILFTQDIMFFEGEPSFSSRLRFSQRKGMNQFSAGIERGFVRERSIRLRWQLVPEIANQLDYINKIDRVAGTVSSARSRDILSDAITFDISYRPEQRIELGMKFDVARATDRFQLPALTSDFNAQTVRFVYAITGSGQIRAETAREEIVLGSTPANLPFELTGGRVAGKTWLWRGALDYRVTQFIQATVNYDARSEGGRAPVHSARAEVRAFF